MYSWEGSVACLIMIHISMRRVFLKLDHEPYIDEKGCGMLNHVPPLHVKRGVIYFIMFHESMKRGVECLNHVPWTLERWRGVLNNIPWMHEKGHGVLNRVPWIHEKRRRMFYHDPWIHEEGRGMLNHKPWINKNDMWYACSRSMNPWKGCVQCMVMIHEYMKRGCGMHGHDP